LLDGGRPHDVVALEARNRSNERLISHLNIQVIFKITAVFILFWFCVAIGCIFRDSGVFTTLAFRFVMLQMFGLGMRRKPWLVYLHSVKSRCAYM